MEDSKELNGNNTSEGKLSGERINVDPDRIDEQADLSDEEKRILKEVRSLTKSIEGDKTEILVVASNPDWKGVIAMGATYGKTKMGRLSQAVKKTVSTLF